MKAEEDQRILNVLERCTDRFETMIEMSEQRMERTNKMVCDLAATCKDMQETIEFLTKEYCQRMQTLVDQRDLLIKENIRQSHMYQELVKAMIQSNGGKVVVNINNIQRRATLIGCSFFLLLEFIVK